MGEGEPSLLRCGSTGTEFRLDNSWGNGGGAGGGGGANVIGNRLTSLAWGVHISLDKTSWDQGRLSKVREEQEEVPRVAVREFDKHFSVHV